MIIEEDSGFPLCLECMREHCPLDRCYEVKSK